MFSFRTGVVANGIFAAISIPLLTTIILGCSIVNYCTEQLLFGFGCYDNFTFRLLVYFIIFLFDYFNSINPTSKQSIALKLYNMEREFLYDFSVTQNFDYISMIIILDVVVDIFMIRL